MAALRVWRNAGVAQTGCGMIGSPQIKISAIALRRCRNLDTSVNLESARSQTGAYLGPCNLREVKQAPVYLHPTFPITTRLSTSCSTLSA